MRWLICAGLPLSVQERQSESRGIKNSHARIFTLPRLTRWGQEAFESRYMLRDCSGDRFLGHETKIFETLTDLGAGEEHDRESVLVGHIGYRPVETLNTLRSRRAVTRRVLKHNHFRSVSREYCVGTRQNPLQLILSARFDHTPVEGSKWTFKQYKREAPRI